jgi:hypothetical protein
MTIRNQIFVNLSLLSTYSFIYYGFSNNKRHKDIGID